MTNKEIAKLFSKLGKLLELHGESSFKTRAYDNAYRVIRSLTESVWEMDEQSLIALPGIGKAISEKIIQLKQTGSISTLDKYMQLTPEGVQDILEIKGLGPKKVEQIWKQLGIESVGELIYACSENRLVDLKGFGSKTQEDILAKAQFFLASKGWMHYRNAFTISRELIEHLEKRFPTDRFELTGDLRRQANVIEQIDIIGTAKAQSVASFISPTDSFEGSEAIIKGVFQNAAVRYYFSDHSRFGSDWYDSTISEGYKTLVHGADLEAWGNYAEEEDLFEAQSLPYILPERREEDLLSWPTVWQSKVRVEESDIKGIIHAHSHYSDGSASLKEMADYCASQGFEYLVITDHSKSAFYANGLDIPRLKQQWDEIDSLNAANQSFRIYKGIESDILMDGSLDYPNEILSQFEVVIASVHAHLRMDEAKATERLIKAIENKYTTMLGHPTGRLLLSRQGYPIDYKKVIDAAAACGVAIEINSNPYRLDIDWTWIPYALEKGVKLSINPDAHSLAGIHDITWGLPVANKGGAKPENLLCCMNQKDFSLFLSKKKH